MSFIVVIPARYESSRLPGKPLKEIMANKTMIQGTWEQAKKSGASRVVIATDNVQVKEVCEKFGAEVCMTNIEHKSGTERLGEVVTKLNFQKDDIIVNVQGDEPMLPPELIHQVAEGLETHIAVNMATLCEPIDNIKTVFDPHAVKVIRNQKNFALNFTRAPMPWSRDTFDENPSLPTNWAYKRHIGLYAYRAGFIKQYISWEECQLEKVEKLEQLRVLWHGEQILVLDALMDAGIGVDTKQDLDKVRKLLLKNG
jgi:3-deoxy-manno-octulosonate cytidylyltransferase (CMP-KDO synthetase)